MRLQKHAVAVSTPLWLGQVYQTLRRLVLPVLEKKPPGLVSVTVPAPLPKQVSLPERLEHRFYWCKPAGNKQLMGLGRAKVIEAEGETRFSDLNRAYTELQDHWTQIIHGKVDVGAKAFLGFSFDPAAENSGLWRGFSNSQLVVPELMCEWNDDRCKLTFTCDPESGFEPEEVFTRWREILAALVEIRNEPGDGLDTGCTRCRDEVSRHCWLERIEQIKKEIDAEIFSKVVLTRSKRVTADRSFRLNSLLSRLTAGYATCTIVAVDGEDSTLVAATPEKLLSVRGDRVESDALAGTLHCGDRSASPGMKLYEHDPVVEAICTALEPLCEEVNTEASPGIMELGAVSHLWTRVRGRIRPDASLFDLLGRLHPTPAVGGVPRREALKWISRHDDTPRGWYTGGVGWLGNTNEGDISVLLRCALLRERSADLFAGAGITQVSDPYQEFMETELKFTAILQALGATSDGSGADQS